MGIMIIVMTNMNAYDDDDEDESGQAGVGC